jgi:hypothetical protein
LVVGFSFINNTAIIEANKGAIETNGVDSVAVKSFKVEKTKNLPSPIVKKPAIKKIVKEFRVGKVLVIKE